MPRISKPATKARRKKEDESRHATVLDAAEKVFQVEGYQTATAEKIAASAGVSVGTIYNLFGSKKRIYAGIISRIAQQMLDYVKDSILPIEDSALAIERLILFRLSNFERQRLFLVLFSCERSSGAYPDPETLSEKIRAQYGSYLDYVASIFERSPHKDASETRRALHLALSFEGVLNAFVGYWSGPGAHKQPVKARARYIKDAVMRMVELRRTGSDAESEATASEQRDIYITSFDLVRLKELITVARGFGAADAAVHLNELGTRLSCGKIVDPTLVPHDVLTMNSRFRLSGASGGEASVLCLVFPVDADKDPSNISVLDPLGTSLLGRRVGDTVEAHSPNGSRQYKILEILYQPESAGDYHR